MKPPYPNSKEETLDVKETIRLQRIKKLEALARTEVGNVWKRLYAGTRIGLSTEWTGLREYVPGDDARSIHGIASAKTGKLVVKEYEPERDTQFFILLDTSGTMELGETKSLIEQGVVAAGSLAFISIRNKDRIGFASFSDVIKDIILPSKRQDQFYRILEKLCSLSVGGETDIRGAIQAVSNILKRRSLIFVVTDLYDKPMDVIKGVLYAKSKGHKVLFIQVVDPDPLAALIKRGITKFRDEKGEVYDLGDPLFLNLVHNIIEQSRKKFVDVLIKAKIEVVSVKITDLVRTVLLRYFITRQRALMAR